MSDPRHYSAFGLLIRSDLSIPDLSEVPAALADVEIRIGETPAELAGEEVLRRANWAAVPGRWLMTIAGVGRYCVTGGKDIRIDPAPGADPNDLVSFLIGSAFAALLQQRRILPLHAGAVCTDAGAVLVTAPSGVGKSTLVADLVRRGLPLLADDVTGIVFDSDGTPMALPGLPMIRLWRDSAAALEMDLSKGRVVRKNISKRSFAIPDPHLSPVPVRLIIGLGTHNRDSVASEPLNGWERVSLILDNVFRKRYLEGLEMLDLQFITATALSRSVQVHRLLRPAGRISHEEVADQVMALIEDARPPSAASV